MNVTGTIEQEPLEELQDVNLVERVAAGDQAALEVLYTRYSRVVFSFAFRILGDRAVAEEILQEVFFRAWQQARNFTERRGTFITWILSITHNMAIDEIRKRNRRPQRAESADPVLLLTNVRDESPSVEELAMLTSLREQIGNALATLPDAQRETIELAYFRGLTQREISEQLGEPLGTVKTRMRLGIRKLKSSIDGLEGGLR